MDLRCRIDNEKPRRCGNDQVATISVHDQALTSYVKKYQALKQKQFQAKAERERVSETVQLADSERSQHEDDISKDCETPGPSTGKTHQTAAFYSHAILKETEQVVSLLIQVLAYKPGTNQYSGDIVTQNT